MKRPFAVIGFSFLGGLFLASVIDIKGLLLTTGISIALSVISLIFAKKIKYISAVLWTLSLALVLFSAYTYSSVLPVSALKGQSGNITAVVKNADTVGAKYVYTVYVENNSVNPEIKFNALIKSNSSILKVNDKITAQVDFEEVGLNSDSDQYYYGKKIFIGCQLTDEINMQVSENTEFDLGIWLYSLRNKLSDILHRALPEQSASLTDVLLLGNTRWLDDSVTEDFRYAGISHIIVVSGMHLSIIGYLILSFMGGLKIRKRITYFIAIPIIILYALITGGNLSVVRSAIMYILCMLALIIGREQDSLSVLGIAVTIICVSNPYAVMDYGFLLSVFATLGILILTAPISEYIISKIKWAKYKGVSYIVSLLAASLSAYIFILPITVIKFGGYSLLSIISTLIVSLPVLLIIYSGILIIILGGIFLPLTGVLGIVHSLICKFVLWYTATVPRSFYVNSGELSELIFIFVIIVTAIVFMVKSVRVRLVAIGCILVVCLCVPIINTVYFSSITRVTCTALPSGKVVSVIENGEAKVLNNRGYVPKTIKNLIKETGTDENKITLSSDNMFEVNGVKFIFDTDTSPQDNKSCDIYICDEPQRSVYAGFTIIGGNDIIDEKLQTVPRGNYIVQNVYETVIMDVDKNGDIRFLYRK